MADTAVEAVMEIVGDIGCSGDPKTVVEALELLREGIDDVANQPMTNTEIDAITEG